MEACSSYKYILQDILDEAKSQFKKAPLLAPCITKTLETKEQLETLKISINETVLNALNVWWSSTKLLNCSKQYSIEVRHNNLLVQFTDSKSISIEIRSFHHCKVYLIAVYPKFSNVTVSYNHGGNITHKMSSKSLTDSDFKINYDHKNNHVTVNSYQKQLVLDCVSEYEVSMESEMHKDKKKSLNGVVQFGNLTACARYNFFAKSGNSLKIQLTQITTHSRGSHKVAHLLLILLTNYFLQLFWLLL